MAAYSSLIVSDCVNNARAYLRLAGPSNRLRRSHVDAVRGYHVGMARDRILVVDDEPGLLRSAERILGDDYDVLIAGLPSEALRRAATFTPDLAILDIRMPEMTGFDLMDRLLAMHPGVDFILMTGSASRPDEQLIRAIKQRAFYFIQKPFDREVLRTLVARCFELRRLSAENRSHVSRLESELSEVRVFLTGLLPPSHAVVNGVRISARWSACTEVGGDLFDYVAVGGDAVAMIVADVAGHGVSAAMLAGTVKAAFHAGDVEGYAPREVVARVYSALRAFGTERFVTLFCARIVPARQRIEFVNGGHPPPILRRADGTTTGIGATGPILSPAFPDDSWIEESFGFGPGDRLLVHTDGLADAAGTVGPFGRRRIEEQVASSRHGGAAFINDLFLAVARHVGGCGCTDDITAVCVELARTD